MPKFLITHSLLSSFDWAFKKEDGLNEFINTLQRKPLKPTQAILDGRQFEDMVTAYANGAPLDESHKWADGIKEIGNECKGGVFQVKGSLDVVIDGVAFVLYGIADNIAAGVIRDIKFSKSYSFGKYARSTQHPMYFRLFPQANKFDYLIYNGKDVSRETYYPFDTPPIEDEIRVFMTALDRMGLVKTYTEYWRSQYE